jgi:O-6-methylguanine DNA methyltransferase
MRSGRNVPPEVVRMRVPTALGEFMIQATPRGLRAVTPVRMRDESAGRSGSGGPAVARAPEARAARVHLQAAGDALRRYADREPVRFEGPLDVPATAFHLSVWERLRAIPYGTTATYGEIAAALGMPGEAQAVGAAVGANRVCILVPCHRVVGADGSLRGFAWGLDLKCRLLAHEGSAALHLFEDAPSR